MLNSNNTRHNIDSDEVAHLQEPIPATILKDVTDIGLKCQYVVSPSAASESGGILKKWDLWGPLFISLIFALFLWIQAPIQQKRSVFGLGFMLPWVGSLIVYLNASFLGSNVSLFQTISILGYSNLPLAGLSLLSVAIPRQIQAIKLPFAIGAIFVAQRASSSYLESSVKGEKKWLVLYPLVLYYLLLGWIIVVL